MLGLTGVIPQSVLPLMSTVLGHAARLLGNGRFLADLGATLEAWAVGLALAIVIGVPLGVLLGSLPCVRVGDRAVVGFLPTPVGRADPAGQPGHRAGAADVGHADRLRRDLGPRRTT